VADYYDDFKPYVPVGARRAQAARQLARLQKKGRIILPVVIEGRKIASTFWGEAWCANLERYSDYANRLPRGRSYVRSGSVVDLHVEPGCVNALVSGSTMYEVKVTVAPVPDVCWRGICTDCSGAIDSLIELLQGRLSKAVMTRLCQPKTGLFPSPRDILFTCNCPDWASMCKHVAAVLYGIGARLDHQPGLLFTLRKVDQQDLIAEAGSDLATPRARPAGARVLPSDGLSELFGIDIAPPAPPVAAPKRTAGGVAAGRSTSATSKAKASSSRPKPPSPDQSSATAARRRDGKKRMTPAGRQAIAERMRAYWAARRALAKKQKAAPSS
jgi:uncharacterized Zn finger protein